MTEEKIWDNLAGGSSSTADRLVPYCMFTDPPLANVGLSESETLRPPRDRRPCGAAAGRRRADRGAARRRLCAELVARAQNREPELLPDSMFIRP